MGLSRHHAHVLGARASIDASAGGGHLHLSTWEWPRARGHTYVQFAAYYCVAETLANAAKHADATVIEVAAEADNTTLRVIVRDDGKGGAKLGGGTGLVGIADRVEAAGGRLSLDSPPGAGTTVTITLPHSPRDQTGEGDLSQTTEASLDPTLSRAGASQPSTDRPIGIPATTATTRRSQP